VFVKISWWYDDGSDTGLLLQTASIATYRKLPSLTANTLMPNKCTEIGFRSPVKCPVFFF